MSINLKITSRAGLCSYQILQEKTLEIGELLSYRLQQNSGILQTAFRGFY